MIAFFCSTPYQIIVALTLRALLGVESPADVYILNHFRKAEQVAENLRRTGAFRGVEIVDGRAFLLELRRSEHLRLLNKAWIYLRYQTIVDRYVRLGSTQYDHVFLSVPDVLPQLILKRLHDRNPKLKVHLFEDGLGSYGGAFLQTTALKRVFSRLTGYHNIIDRYEDLWVFRPEHVTGSFSFPIKAIPPSHVTTPEIKSLLSVVFDYVSTGEIQEDVVFFEQPIDSRPGLNDGIRSIVERLPRSDVLVKLHPRGHAEDYDGWRVYEQSDVPWEVVAFDVGVQERVLISFFSTALTSSKILLNAEPTIVFLYAIPELRKLWDIPEPAKEFVVRFRETYTDPSRVLVPRSIEEFDQIFERRLR